MMKRKIKIYITYILLFNFFSSALIAQVAHSVLGFFDTTKVQINNNNRTHFTPKIELYPVTDVQTDQIDGMLIYNYSEENNLPANSVNEIIKDKDGFLWIGSNKGLLKFDGNTFFKIILPDSLSSAEVRSIALDKNGALWISIYSYGLLKYDKGEMYLMNDLAVDLNIRKIFVSSDSTVWLGCDNGFCTIKNNISTKYHYQEKKSGYGYYYAVIHFSEDYNNNVWIAPFGSNILVKGKEKTIEIAIDTSSINDWHFQNSKTPSIVHFKNGQSFLVNRSLKLILIENYKIIKRYSYTESMRKQQSVIPYSSDLIFWDNFNLFATSRGLYTLSENYDSLSVVNSAFLKDIRCANLRIYDNALYVSKGNGFCIIKKPKPYKKYISNFNINSLKSFKDNIYITTLDYNFYKYVDETNITSHMYTEFINTNKKMEISDINNRHILFVGKNNLIYLVDRKKDSTYKYASKNTQLKNFNCILPQGTASKALLLNDSVIAMFGFKVITLLNIKTHTIIKEIPVEDDIADAQRANNRDYIFSTEKKLFKINLSSCKIEEIFKATEGIINAFIYSENYLWLCTSSGYIHRISNKNYSQINSIYNQTIEKSFNKGMRLAKEKVFIITNTGIFYFDSNDFNKNKLDLYQLQINSVGNTSLGEYQLDYSTSQEKLYYSFNNALFTLNYKDLFENDNINTYISKLQINDNVYSKAQFQYWYNSITLPYDSTNIKIFISAISDDLNKISHYMYKLSGYDENWTAIYKSNVVLYGKLPPGNYTLKYKAVSKTGVESNEKELKIIITPPFWRTNWFYALCIILLAVVIYMIIKLRLKRLKLENIRLENIVSERTQEIRLQKDEIEKKKNIITESILYAKKIQDSLLPSQKLLQSELPNIMIYYSPKDIVSGDFYWFKQFENYSLIACVDCTGHGVPGGFMSTMGNLLIDKVTDISFENTGEILSNLSNEIIRVLNQDKGGEIQDGMDLSLCLIDKKNKKIEFSGARNGIIVISNGTAKRYKADLLPVGGNYIKKDKPILRNFKTTTIELSQNDWVYMYTDGYIEQIGGNDNLPMNYAQFENILIQTSEKNHSEKIEFLQKNINEWKGKNHQDDDILIIGVQL